MVSAINTSCKDPKQLGSSSITSAHRKDLKSTTNRLVLLHVKRILNDPNSYVNDPQKPWMQTGATVILDENTKFYEPPTYLPSFSSTLKSEIDPLIQQVLAGKMSCKDMLDKWSDIMTKLLKEEG